MDKDKEIKEIKEIKKNKKRVNNSFILKLFIFILLFGGLFTFYFTLFLGIGSKEEDDPGITGPSNDIEKNYERTLKDIPEIEFNHYEISKDEIINNNLVSRGGKDIVLPPKALEKDEVDLSDIIGKDEEPDNVEDPVDEEPVNEEPVDNDPDTNKNKVNPDDLNSIIDSEIEKNNYQGIDVNLVKAMISVDSEFISDKISTGRDNEKVYGLMQISEGTFKYIAENILKENVPSDKTDLNTNIRYGMAYLNYMAETNSDIHYMLTAYRKGPKGVEDHYNENGTYESEYSRNVISQLEVFSVDTK